MLDEGFNSPNLNPLTAVFRYEQSQAIIPIFRRRDANLISAKVIPLG